MCGIVGLLRPEPIDPAVIANAAAAIAHRGPDDAGVWVSADGTVGLGHRRLSIVDLSPSGHQPFVKPGLVLVYNGEVYNFPALRAELEGRGHTFRSRTDTEVVLEAYRAWGPRCVSRLRGMFAFALWDQAARRLVLARDRLGIKPLYWYEHPRGDFAFGSELKALEALPGLDLTVDDTALWDFLTYLYVPAPKTPYARARKLPPGHVLIHEDGRTRLEQYWEVQPRATGGGAIDELRARLDDAVASHMLADVPVGSLLSGGIDSSAVTMLAQRHNPEPLQTFSIGFDVDARSETRYARQVAAAVGTRHVEETLGLNRARTVAPRLRRLYDEPFGDSSAIPTLLVSEVARRHVKVALSGDGGDELFGGYRWYQQHRRRARYAVVPAPLRDRLPALLEQTPLMKLRGVPKVVDGLRPDLERHVAIMGGFTRAQKARLLPAAQVARMDGYDDYWYFRQHWHEDLDLQTRLQVLDLKTYLPDDILTKVDRASMAVSLELRPPLLDHLLVEHVFSIPSARRTPDGAPKALFKQALVGLVPDTILNREKQGFSIPLDQWIDGLAGGGPAGLSPTQRWLLQLAGGWKPA
ncbi:MAG TPA: asparagine synthase (glutamine-hydrolyzing) [Kofleriaceae bacterium]|nr:asparagine synthase (glutamine-hydrolyzing) [Kofleriaceae bacterium]